MVHKGLENSDHCIPGFVYFTLKLATLRLYLYELPQKKKKNSSQNKKQNLNEQLMHTLFDGSCNYAYQIIYSPSLSFKKNRYFYKLSKDYKNAKKEYTVFKDVLQEKNHY